MELKELQKKDKIFCEERGWDKFPPSLVLIHLYEELSEVGEYILYKDGYKKSGLGNDRNADYENLKCEFGQILSLLMQLANSFDIDIESAFLSEFEIMQKRFGKKEWREYTNNIV